MDAQSTGPGPAVIAPQLIDALVQSSFAVTATLTTVGAAHDLSLTQLRVLGILRDRRTSMSELARYLGLERSTVSGLVDRAEKRGLVRRTPGGDDRRAVEVTLSPDGLDLARTVYAEVSVILAPVLARLEPADQRALRDLLRATTAPEITP